jgi:hypothetical protein
MTLTIVHVSCGFLTSGETGAVSNIVLRAVSNGEGALGDHQLFASSVSGGGNLITSSNSSTTFYVAAGDKPAIDVTSNASFLASSDGGCLVSGSTQAK